MSDFTLNEYQALLYRVAAPDGGHTPEKLNTELSALHRMINIGLPELARKGSPDNFADILQNFQQELQRFRDFCAFPQLAQRNIIGIGGRFSAGKSSFINALLGKKLLNADVNPTTSLPTYLLNGEQNTIHAINLFQQSIELSEREFSSLTHDIQKELGSQVGALLQSAHIQHTGFPWKNLAVLDTPGYTKPETDEYSERTDERIAHAQLNSANYLLWLVSAEDGTITEDDITFLSGLNPEIPRLILVNKADKKTPEDVAAIVALIRKTLADRNIEAADVIAVSSRRKDQYPLEPVWQHLEQWNRHARQTTFARRFKTLFMQYSQYLEDKQRQAAMQLNRLNRILTLSDSLSLTQDAEGLQIQAKIAMELLEQQIEELASMQGIFFKTLKNIGDHVGIEIPEPSEIELLDLGGSKLFELLLSWQSESGEPEKDYSHYWQYLRKETQIWAISKLLRHLNDAFYVKNHLENQAYLGAEPGKIERISNYLAGFPIAEQYLRKQLDSKPNDSQVENLFHSFSGLPTVKNHLQEQMTPQPQYTQLEKVLRLYPQEKKQGISFQHTLN